jgi:hypothetical protein
MIATLYGCIDNPPGLLHPLSFTAEYASGTRNSSTIPEGTTAILHISNTTDTAQNNLFPSTILCSDGNGCMNPPDMLFVKNGYYNIYTLSSGSQEHPPSERFDHNTLTPSNHTDYIWACRVNEAIHGPASINLNFSHIASKITFRVVKPHYCENISVISMKYTLPDTSASSLCITDGTITPATTLLPPVELQGNGNVREVITIPFANISPTLTVSMLITSNGFTSSEITYTTTLGFPVEKGIHYTIELTPQEESDMTVGLLKSDWSVKEDIIPYTAE